MFVDFNTQSKKSWRLQFNLGDFCHDKKKNWGNKGEACNNLVDFCLEEKLKTQSTSLVRSSIYDKTNVNNLRYNQSFHFQMSRRENGKSIKKLRRKLMFTHWRFSFLSTLNHSHPRCETLWWLSCHKKAAKNYNVSSNYVYIVIRKSRPSLINVNFTRNNN